MTKEQEAITEKILCHSCLKEMPLIVTRRLGIRIPTCSEECERKRQVALPETTDPIENQTRTTILAHHRNQRYRVAKATKEEIPEEKHNDSEEGFAWDEQSQLL